MKFTGRDSGHTDFLKCEFCGHEQQQPKDSYYIPSVPCQKCRKSTQDQSGKKKL